MEPASGGGKDGGEEDKGSMQHPVDNPHHCYSMHRSRGKDVTSDPRQTPHGALTALPLLLYLQ